MERDMRPINLSSLKEMKFTVPVTLLIGLVAIGWQAKNFTIVTLDEFFISEAEGSQLAEKIGDLNTTVTKYIAKSEIREINNELDAVNSQITETQLWIAANGSNDIATARLANLVRRKDKLNEIKTCLLNESITDKDICYVE
jgi:hypothetical protein